MTHRYIFVVGGVMSGVGKGVTSASIGKILQSRGFTVTAIKIDPYVNVDAGTMNPVEHGEVFVTDDGDETDQDMGNYERFLETDLTSLNYMTTGRVYQTVIERERNLGYQGRCVQVVPHIPEEVIRRIKKASDHARADFTVVEIGGTVGEYENILFLEAARMMHLADPKKVLFILVSYLPIPKHLGEMKTKPTQHATRTLNSAGIHPDFIVCRGEHYMDKPRREKLSVFCNVRPNDVISAPDVSSIYRIPGVFEKQGFSDEVLKKFGVKPKGADLRQWNTMANVQENAKKTVRIAVVGKYFATGNYTLSDSYISVIEALKHASWANKAKIEMDWINSEDFENNPEKLKDLSDYQGVLVPGGFGIRGIEGVISTVKFCRENKIPYFGICYGMQLATVEFARHVLGKKGAHTVEVDENTTDPIIHVNPVQLKNIRENRYGGTMRLGAYNCDLSSGSIAQKAYKTSHISERHRHRYEFNNDYAQMIQEKGLTISGVNPQTGLVEIVELKDHPFFVGVQFHPEFKSRPLRPHPLFKAFIAAALKK
ncbi:MAG: CTP synthetase [Candidatus Uhrbacteria bacterium GW2011_GWF2_39_13]|uniref:CTP synthase n=1 Tax=Candidatus Uhrbacteria bacterium GW2011_GWF2_39_13 TaxID=1618995 RepID=A0A0G0MPL5_9BACT|nr:MAG: CTP synthetase [Candidatus Uhrbacteria bacterium GW2011_GWF2_39_13]HAU66363.1 CTP synthase [Candidatus Uhrbacteria bacterium]